jgi:ATP/maltotriose-dependent transcriptional regulator MalT
MEKQLCCASICWADPAPGRVVWLSLGGQPHTLQTLGLLLAGELGLSTESSVTEMSASSCGSWPASDRGLSGNENSKLRLVFDDLPAQMPADLNHWFDQLLSLQNPNLQILVTCRQRPEWNLPQLMLSGELLELGSWQLALRPDEFELLVSSLIPIADTATREKFWQQTSGWCAGVRLLPSALIGAYLERELLSRLSEEQREVLFGLAHLAKASADLCEQLWEEQQGARVFRSLLDAQVFLVPIDHQPGWFRLLPSVAQAQQERLRGVPLNRLRLRACQLLGVLEQVDDAVELALSADQPEVSRTTWSVCGWAGSSANGIWSASWIGVNVSTCNCCKAARG